VSTNASPPRRWLRWVVGAVVVIVVLAVGVPFVYIHFIEGKAPAKLTLTTTATGATVPLDGSWVVGPGSLAGYRVGEVLLGQNNTAVGRTSTIDGSVEISGTTVTKATFTVDLVTIKSDESARDRQFQGRIMDTSKYPTATFTLTAPARFSLPSPSGSTISVPATGTLTMHGATKAVAVTLTARQSGATIQVLGSIPIVFADWGIPNPTTSIAKTQNHGTIEFLLALVHGTPSSPAFPTPTTAAPAAPLNPAFRACMAAHGAPLPALPANGATPVARPGGSPGSGGPGAGGPGSGGPGSSPAEQAAIKACRSLLPAGSGFGGGGSPITVSPTTVAPLSL
jgi:polyisoprenoid-binding protein YceI